MSVSCFTLVGNTLFAGTNGGGIFVFNSTTYIWSVVNTGLTNLDIYSLASDGTSIYAGTQGGGVFKSTNLGVNWTAINSGLTFNYVTSLSIGQNNIFTGTNGAGVFRSSNAGTNWTAINTGLTTLDIYSLDMSGTYLYAGSENTGIWKRNLSEITDIAKYNKSNSINVFPNPAADIISLNIESINNDDLKMNIYNVMGTLVKSEVLKQTQPQINISDLSNGVYMVEIKSTDWTGKQKLIIQR